MWTFCTETWVGKEGDSLSLTRSDSTQWWCPCFDSCLVVLFISLLDWTGHCTPYYLLSSQFITKTISNMHVLSVTPGATHSPRHILSRRRTLLTQCSTPTPEISDCGDAFNSRLHTLRTSFYLLVSSSSILPLECFVGIFCTGQIGAYLIISMCFSYIFPFNLFTIFSCYQ